MKRIAFLAGFCLLASLSFAQVSDIKKESNNNQGSKSSSQSSSSGGSSSSGDSDVDAAMGCAQIGCDILTSGCMDNMVVLCGDMFAGFFDAVGTWQKNTLAKKAYLSDVTSFEANLWTGLTSKYGTSVLYPSVRGNWGIVSTDFMYLYMKDFSDEAGLQTFSWQILMLNIVQEKKVKLSIGNGIYCELFSDVKPVFHEMMGELLVRPLPDKFTLGVQGRYARDYQTDAVPRMQFDAFARWHAKNTESARISLQLGYSRQVYYEKYIYDFASLGLHVAIF